MEPLQPALPPRNSIFSPAIDTLCVGGLSILVIGSFLLLSSFIPRDLILSQFAVLTVLINGTHFMASYRLLYSSREYAKRYRAASMYVPGLLVAYAVFALWAQQWKTPQPGFIDALLIINALYLALHYTGQAWGMMSSFAFLEGVRFTPFERTSFKVLLKILAAWQMGWSLTLLTNQPDLLKIWLPLVMNVLNVAAVLTAVAGMVLFGRISLRTKRAPPIRILLPFFLLHIWYCFLWIYPQAIFWVQISHALQYLSFPLRVELNRVQSHADESPGRFSPVLSYLGGITVASIVVFVGIKHGITWNDSGFEAYWLVLASCINIHHYFIDGCIWKLGSPVVREQVFAHIKR